jgi:molybdate transport system substrate-binding protein
MPAMNNHPWTSLAVAFATAGLLASLGSREPISAQDRPAAATGNVRVILSGGFSAAYKELVPEFERTAGITVTTTSGASVGTGPNTIGAQLRKGVPADVVILSREGLSDLIAEKRIVSGSDTDLAQSVLGMIVRAGAPRPDISTVDAFKQTLLRAKGLALTSSTSGVYLTKELFPRLGIAADMQGKTTFAAAGAVARGEAEIGIQQVSELLTVAGVDYIGTLPADVQSITIYAAAIVAGSKQLDVSRKLIAFLASERAAAPIRRSGMEQRTRR